MKRIVLVLLLMMLCLTAVPAETILLCMSDNSPEIDQPGWPQSVLRAVEDGILDVFFESGHIVTNLFFNGSAEEPDLTMPPENITRTAEELNLELANIHGAGVVLDLKIYFPDADDDNLPLPDKIEYTVYRRGRVPGELTEFSLGDLMLESDDSSLDLFMQAGKLLAVEILSQL